MATELFVVTGDQYRRVHRRMREILRELDQNNGSPLNPEKVADDLQEMISPSRSLVDRVETTVYVDRSVDPSYPGWVEKIMDPDLQRTGPAKYDLMGLLPWFRDKQKRDTTKKKHMLTVQTVYYCLKEYNLLPLCLGFHDALAIQKLGATVFWKAFGNNTTVRFWRAVVRNRITGHLCVLGLYAFRDEVDFVWYPFDDSLISWPICHLFRE